MSDTKDNPCRHFSYEFDPTSKDPTGKPIRFCPSCGARGFSREDLAKLDRDAITKKHADRNSPLPSSLKFNDRGLPEDRRFHTAYKCKACKTIIMSTSVHAFVTCLCFKNEEGNEGIFIDGGHDYIRGGGCLSNVETLAIKLT